VTQHPHACQQRSAPAEDSLGGGGGHSCDEMLAQLREKHLCTHLQVTRRTLPLYAREAPLYAPPGHDLCMRENTTSVCERSSSVCTSRSLSRHLNHTHYIYKCPNMSVCVCVCVCVYVCVYLNIYHIYIEGEWGIGC
jgi:hypothetical protein